MGEDERGRGGALGWLRRALGGGEGGQGVREEAEAADGRSGPERAHPGPEARGGSSLGPYRNRAGADHRFSWSGEGAGHHRAVAILERRFVHNVYLARRFGFGGGEGLGALVHFPDELWPGGADASATAAKAMWQDELRAYAALPRHPALCRVFDAGTMGERSSARDDASFPNGRAGLFVALDYVHGAALPELVRRLQERGIRLPEAAAARLVRRAAEALASAAAGRAAVALPMGALHPDLRPATLLVTFAGRPIVDSFAADFTRRGPAPPGDAGELARPEDVAYRAPEQLRGAPPDERASVFSLGAILHELLAGGAREPSSGSALARVAARALAASPEDRFPSLSALAEALELAVPPGEDRLAGLFLRHAMRALFAPDIALRDRLVRDTLAIDA